MPEKKLFPKTPITRDELLHTNAAMFVLTSIFIFSRATVHVTKRKTVELSDFFIYFAYILYTALWSCYIIVIPPMFKVYAVIGLEIAPYQTMMQDAAMMLRLITAGQMCFYTLLFSVKMSLLTLYWKLLAGLPSVYRKVWWGIVAFCVLVCIRPILSFHLLHTESKTVMVGKCLQQHLHLRQPRRKIPARQMRRHIQ